jgi:hypothetical protein
VRSVSSMTVPGLRGMARANQSKCTENPVVRWEKAGKCISLYRFMRRK